MAEFLHGGDVLTAQDLHEGDILDFSANFNPLGMPPEVRRAAEAAAGESDRYPDPFCRRLVEGIAERDGVKKEYVLCGNGAADLIFRLVFAERPRLAMVMAPTFAEYEQALKVSGCRILYHALEPYNSFDLTGEIMNTLTEDLDMLFLCNPNNPTGRHIPQQLMEKIIAACEEMDILLVVDECFIELSDDAAGLSNKVFGNKNLFLLRAFTKSYCMAGLRLGYCITSRGDILERMRQYAQPWSVSHPAQRAGLAALRLPEYPAKAREIISEERDRLACGLKELGIHVFPSSANYILFKTGGVTDLWERMLKRGILIRSCANFPGLGGEYYRVAVRLREDNIKLIDELRGCYDWQRP